LGALLLRGGREGGKWGMGGEGKGGEGRGGQGRGREGKGRREERGGRLSTAIPNFLGPRWG